MKNKLFEKFLLSFLASLSIVFSACSPAFATQSVIVDASAGSCTDLAPTNTGTGTCTISNTSAFVLSEAITFTATTSGSGATFTVVGATSGSLGTITAGSTQTVYQSGLALFQVNLTNGGTGYVIGDNFRVTFTAGTDLSKATFDLFTLTQICSNGCSAGAALTATQGTFNSVIVGSAANRISGLSTIINTGTLTLPTATDTLVGRATTDTLTNKTLTTPVISSITNTGTLTLPTSTDTLVGRATTDTLTNKTLTTPVIVGITDGSTAAAGNAAEPLTASRLKSAETSLTTSTTVNVTSLSVTAGDWLLWGFVGFDAAASTTVTSFDYGISTTSITFPATDTMGVQDTAGQIRFQDKRAGAVLAGNAVYSMAPVHIHTSSTTTYFLLGNSVFGTSTMGVFGSIRAVRLAR